MTHLNYANGIAQWHREVAATVKNETWTGGKEEIPAAVGLFREKVVQEWD